MFMELFNYPQVEDALLQYKRLKARMNAILTVLESCQKKLNDEIYWSGSGCDYLKQKFALLMDNNADLRYAMTNLCAYLSGVIDNHKLTEQRIANLLGGGNK